MEQTESDGLWCSGGCFASEFDVWFAMQTPEEREAFEEECKVRDHEMPFSGSIEYKP